MIIQEELRQWIEEHYDTVTLNVEEEYERKKAEFHQRSADFFDQEELRVVENISILDDKTKEDFNKCQSTHPRWKNMKKKHLYRIKCTRALYKKYKLEKWLYSFWKKVGLPTLVFKLNGKVGLKDYKGDILLSAEYDEIRLNYNEEELTTPLYIMVRKGKWGVVDTEGRVQLPLEYDNIYPIDSADYAVKLKGKWGVYSVPDHKWRLSCSHDRIYSTPPSPMTSALVFSDNRKFGWTGCSIPEFNSEAKYDAVYLPCYTYFKDIEADEAVYEFLVRNGTDWYRVKL